MFHRTFTGRVAIAEDQFQFCSTKAGGNEVKIDTYDKLDWVESGIYTRTGIRTSEEHYFAGGNSEPEKYGYRWGTSWDAKNIYRMREQRGIVDPLAETIERKEVEQSATSKRDEGKKTPAALLSQSIEKSVLKQQRPATASQVSAVELECLALKKENQRQEETLQRQEEALRALEENAEEMRRREKERERERNEFLRTQRETQSLLSQFFPGMSEISSGASILLTEQDCDPKKHEKFRHVVINQAEQRTMMELLVVSREEDEFRREEQEYRITLLEESKQSKQKGKHASASFCKCSIL